MNERKERPGVVLYFDTLCPALNILSDDQCGCLLRGIVEYAQTGAVPELEAVTGAIFMVLRSGIDRDNERYEQKKEKSRIHGKYMAYRREMKRQGVKVEDMLSEEDYQDLLLDANSSYQLQTDATSNIKGKEKEKAAPAPTQDLAPTAEVNLDENIKRGGVGKGNGEGNRGEERGNLDELQRRFCEELDAGNLHAAGSIANQLYRLGYDIDKDTRQMTRRA